MNVLILSTSNPYKIAGIVALDIYNGLKRQSDNEVKLLVKDWDNFPDNGIASVESYFSYLKRKLIGKLIKIFSVGKVKSKKEKLDSNYHIQDYDQTISLFSTKKILKRVKFKPDVIIVLFMQNFLSFKNIYELNERTKAPVYIYLMDMAPMTGGCHYAWKCKGYEKNCGNCPALYSELKEDQSYMNWKFKKKYIDNTEIEIIAATEWTLKQLKRSSLFLQKKKHKILLPINEQIFNPNKKTEARKKLKLPQSKKIIFFGAVSTKFKRKGFDLLLESLTILGNALSTMEVENVHLAIAGRNIEEEITNLPFSYTELGYLSHEELAYAFQASDLYVSPSIEDSGPMMINQSIMCGTPVVSFEVGVALDLVLTDITGYRAKLANVEELAKGVQAILELTNKEYEKLCDNCSEMGRDYLSLSGFVNHFIKIVNGNRLLL